jgi:hypothetical protein
MALATYPAVSSPVKSVQRGSAAGAGTVTITAIDITKSFVNVFGTTSSGTVSASFNMSMNAGSFVQIGNREHPGSNNNGLRPSGSNTIGATYYGGAYGSVGAWESTRTVNSGTASVGAGSNNLVAAVVQGYLSGSTSLVVTGACRWEVVEFN